MEYGQHGESLFSLAFYRRKEAAELYLAVSGEKELRTETLRIASAGDGLWLEAEGRPTVVAAHYMNLLGESLSLPWSWMLPAGHFPAACPQNSGGISAPKIRRVVFYSGGSQDPDETVLDLYGEEKQPAVLAVNIGGGSGSRLLEESRRLQEYGCFVDEVKNGLRQGLGPERAVKRAAAWGTEHHMLKDLLEERGCEVRDLILRQYEAESSVVREKKLSYAAGMTAGMLRGEAEGMARLLLGILEGFGPVPSWLEETLSQERNCRRLQDWGIAASRSGCLEEFLRRAALDGGERN